MREVGAARAVEGRNKSCDDTMRMALILLRSTRALARRPRVPETLDAIVYAARAVRAR
jgi:hypothetical protein